MMPDSKRKCRDALGCIVFLAFWIGMIVIGIFGFYKGKWQRLSAWMRPLPPPHPSPPSPAHL
jgi:hypothetical protein